MNKAIFLDRDGTINKEVNYLYKPNDFILIPGTIDAIKSFHSLGYIVIVITNQAGVARGFYSEDDVKILHNYVDQLLEVRGTHIDSYYYCPHHPQGVIDKYSTKCECRKPQTGMLEKAVNDFDIDLTKSIIVGDKEIDIEAGKNSGVDRCILVRSGHIVDESKSSADGIFDNLHEFAKLLVKENQ